MSARKEMNRWQDGKRTVNAKARSLKLRDARRVKLAMRTV